MFTSTKLYNRYLYPRLVLLRNLQERTFLGGVEVPPHPSLCIYSSFLSGLSGSSGNATEAQLSFHVLAQLRAYARLGFVNILVITSSRDLSEFEMASIVEGTKSVCALVVFRKNFGYDFFSWKRGMKAADRLIRAEPSEVIFTNDSILGPLSGLSRDASWLRENPGQIALKGLTRSEETANHLQSYFLYFNPALCAQGVLSRWLSRIRPYRTKSEVILNLEIGGSRELEARGVELLARYNPSNGSRSNPTLYCWDELIEKFQFPFLKKSLFSFHAHLFDREKLTLILNQLELHDDNREMIAYLKRL